LESFSSLRGERMSTGQDPAAIVPAVTEVRDVGRIPRLSVLNPKVPPIRSTDTLGCSGITAEILRTDDLHLGRFALQDISVAFLHRGSIEAHFELASISHSFSQGGILILPPDSTASFRLTDADCTIAYLRPDQLPGFDIAAFGRLEIVPQLDPVDLQVTFLLACIRDELEAECPGGRRLMESLALALATHIFGRYATGITSNRRFRGGLTARQVRRAQHTMTSALDQSVPLARLAEDAGLSPWYFCRAFKKSTGLSPHRWMRMNRLEQARTLMADDRRSLTSIAIDLGFSSLSHFSSTFKQATGISPTVYRRRSQS
jgi:AraC family transcriptional regulator